MIQPLRGKLHIEIIPDHKLTQSGIYIATTINEIPHRGKVIALGRPFMDNNGREHPWQLELGEIVHFKRQWDNIVKHGIIKLSDIIAVENEEGIRAIGENVMVKRHYTGGIGNIKLIIPDSAKAMISNEEDFYGEVISEGLDSKFNFKKGDKIIYHRNEGSKVYFNEEELWVLKQRAVLAKI